MDILMKMKRTIEFRDCNYKIKLIKIGIIDQLSEIID